MTQAYAQLIESVHATRQVWRLRRLVEGLLLVAGFAAIVLVAAVAIDRLAPLPGVGRLLTALLLYGGVAMLGWRYLAGPLLARHTDDYFAALIEQRQPDIGNRLINALQLGRSNGDGVASRLIDAIVGDGVMASEQVRPGAVVANGALKRHSAVAAVGGVMVAALLLLGGPGAGTSLSRVLLPWADIDPFTYNSVFIERPGPDDRRVLEGEALEVRALVEGRPVERAELHYEDHRGARRAVAMERTDDQRFRYGFAAVEGPMILRAVAGDGRSVPVAIDVEPRPRVASMQVEYRAPAYTALGAETISDFDGHLRGLPSTEAVLTVRSNKPLDALELLPDDASAIAFSPGDDASTWTMRMSITEPDTYRLRLTDTLGHTVVEPTTYTITLLRDEPPSVAFASPGRDIQLGPEDDVRFVVVAQDRYGLGPVRILGQRDGRGEEVFEVHRWDNAGPPRQRLQRVHETTVAELGLKEGERLQYWAVAEDRNDITGPGTDRTRRFNIVVLTPDAADALLARRITDYARAVTEILRLQRLNRGQTEALADGEELADRQGTIRHRTLQLARVMEQQAFPARTLVLQLRRLGQDEMAQAVGLLEGYRDAASRDDGRALAEASLPVQDEIIEQLEDILLRLTRTEQVRRQLERIRREDPIIHRDVTDQLAKLADAFDRFLTDIREIEETYEKMVRRDDRDVTGEDLAELEHARHRLDRWGEWAKDSVDEISRLPDGFVKDSALAESVNTIFEEIEKQERGPTREIATPVEEGAKALATEVREDLEMWMPHSGDSTAWVMEDAEEGRFEVPEAVLPADLQDIVGDLIEDLDEFDEDADDTTGSWGGNMQVGWDIVDGPMSSFAAVGKTGNQLPNQSEMSGRSGAGRRGKASGQMVGEDSPAMEGRPTPARLTAEPYEEGHIDAQAQLDPRGATGGGKKTGAGTRGLQGGTPPDFIRDMDRLTEQQQLMIEKAQRVARELDYRGRPTDRVHRAIELLEQAQEDMRDLRYDDSARRRKAALGELRALQSQVDAAVSMALQKAPSLPPDLRQQIVTGSRQAMPQGFEDLVGAYYAAIASDEEIDPRED